jgi:hypothetical protein
VKIRGISFVLFLTIVFACPVGAFSPDDEVVLAFPPIKLQKGERIVGFEISVTTGHIIAVDRIPQDWSVSIQAQVSSKSAISGAPGHGAGALFTAAELPKVTIRVGKPAFGNLPKFTVEATLHVTLDFEKTRTVQLRQTELLLKKKGI